tara:strand:- start:675 stop:1142 length:468 start_codon:yes stop_codon:yes gene_type:complete
MPGPIELKTKEQHELWREYTKKIRCHNSYKIKNFEYFKKNRMDEWEEELKRLNRDMREKMKILQIQQNKEQKERLQMEKEEEIINIGVERIKNTIRYEKIKETRKKNKEMKPVRKSKRIKEQNEVEIISIKTLEQTLKEKMEKAIQTGNYIDLTI